MLIDCDIHHGGMTRDYWLTYLDEPYRTEWKRWGPRALASGIRSEDGGNRRDANSDSPEQVISQLLDRYGHRYGLLTGNYGRVGGHPDPDYAAAVCKAMNDYTIEQWLPKDPRFLTGIKVPLQDPQLAVAEIERLAGHPQIVAILFYGTANRIPFGQRYFWPIYQAAVKHHLPIHVHPTTGSVIANHSTTPAGMATSYLETHVCLPQFYMANLVSLLLEGVFEMFPDLRFALVEGGFSWLPHVMWRTDKEYKGLQQQAPRLKRLPSEYIRDHIRLTTQPIEEPAKAEHFGQLLDMMGGDQMLMYASDFPHFDFDPPEVVPKRLGPATLRRIMHDNAAAFFNLPVPSQTGVPS